MGQLCEVPRSLAESPDGRQVLHNVSDCQIQAEASQRVQREISITLQIGISTRERQPSVDFPLHRGRSETDTLPIPLQVPVRVEITLPFTLSVPILGRTQVRRTLAQYLLPLFSVIMSDGPELVICREKICLFWHECNVHWSICRKLVFAAPF